MMKEIQLNTLYSIIRDKKQVYISSWSQNCWNVFLDGTLSTYLISFTGNMTSCYYMDWIYHSQNIFELSFKIDIVGILMFISSNVILLASYLWKLENSENTGRPMFCYISSILSRKAEMMDFVSIQFRLSPYNCKLPTINSVHKLLNKYYLGSTWLHFLLQLNR